MSKEKPQEQLDESAQELQGRIDNYADVLANSDVIIAAYKRFTEIRDIVPEINEQLDRKKYVLYTEPRVPNSNVSVFQKPSEEEGWVELGKVNMQGFARPFIGDTLVNLDDGRILVADTVRNVAIDSIRKLEIRPREDKVVQEFASEEATNTIRDVGRTASKPTLRRDRWGREDITE